MLALTLSLLLTGLLLALPVFTWRAYKNRRDQSGRAPGKFSFRLLAGCAIMAWSAQIIRYIILIMAQGPIEARQAAHLSAPLGWLVWVAALLGVIIFAIMEFNNRRA